MADEGIGIVLIVVGVVLMFVGLVSGFVCAIGLVLLVVGIILLATERTRAPMYAYPGYGYPAQPPYGYPPQFPGAAAPAPPAATGQPVCPVCGSALAWVPQYSRWYCSRCGAYR